MIRAETLRRFALSLPGASEQPHFHLASFRVGGRIFMTLPPEHDHVRVFVGDDQREVALSLHPDCVSKLWWGKKVCGLRVELAKVPPAVARQLVESAWKSKAPRPRRPPRR